MKVIVLVSDTFRYGLLNDGFMFKRGVYAHLRNPSRLAKGSVSFNREYLASFPTVPNRHDLFTGKHTYVCLDWAPHTKDEVALPEMLKKAGYLTAMVTNTPHIIQNSNKFDRGFDSCLRIRGQENDGYRTDPRQLTLPCKPEKLRSMETTLQHMRNNYWRRLEEDWISAKTARAAIDWLQMNYCSHFFLCVDLSLSRLLRST